MNWFRAPHSSVVKAARNLMKLRTLCPALMLAVAGAACTGAPASPGMTIRVGIYPTIDMLPLYVMEHEGIASRHGFTLVKSEPYAGGLAVAEALAKDEVDVAYPGIVPLLSLAAKGTVPADVIVVGCASAADQEHPVTAVVTGAGIQTWKDLEGRQVATHSATSTAAATFIARMKAEGFSRFEFVIIGFPDMGLAVRDGTVAAALMDEPYLTQSLLRGDGHVLGYTMGQPPLPSTPVVAIAARAELAGTPQLAAFVRSHVEAVRFIRDHPTEARNLLVRELGVSKEVAAQVQLRYSPPDARLDVNGLAQLQGILVDAGALAGALDLSSLYSPGILESILAPDG
jgi:ABC-type nitrate/sulfonate/bicarbonate transport system substrate-binding protein